jgi:hypothetical protein
MRRFNWFTVALVGLILFFAGCMVIGLDYALSDLKPVGVAVVLEKVYEPSRTTYGTDSKGHMESHYHSEEWIVIFRFKGKTYKTHTSADTWGVLNRGDKCQAMQPVGIITSYGYTIQPMKDHHER